MKTASEKTHEFYESLVGKKFGRWTVEKTYRDPKRAQSNWRLVIKCVCGTKKEMAVNNLQNGRSKGCRVCYLKRVRG